jgi:hypothetical protein
MTQTSPTPIQPFKRVSIVTQSSQGKRDGSRGCAQNCPFNIWQLWHGKTSDTSWRIIISPRHLPSPVSRLCGQCAVAQRWQSMPRLSLLIFASHTACTYTCAARHAGWPHVGFGNDHHSTHLHSISGAAGSLALVQAQRSTPHWVWVLATGKLAPWCFARQLWYSCAAMDCTACISLHWPHTPVFS